MTLGEHLVLLITLVIRQDISPIPELFAFELILPAPVLIHHIRNHFEKIIAILGVLLFDTIVVGSIVAFRQLLQENRCT